ncbi:MAG: Arm DNA-binding domain-containing protein, partial [Bacteroidales bacterium]
MANYTPFVKPNYISKDGTMPIYIRYNYDRTRRTLIAIGYSIKPEHWDEKKKWVKRICPRFDEIDAVLTKVISKIGNILTFAKDNDIDPVIE